MSMTFWCNHVGPCFGPPFPSCPICTEKAIRELANTWRSDRQKGMTIGDVQFLIDSLLAERNAVLADAALLQTVTRGKSPCGHWSAYAMTEDGGKRIQCLQCDNISLAQLVRKAETSAREASRLVGDAVTERDAAQRELAELRRAPRVPAGPPWMAGDWCFFEFELHQIKHVNGAHVHEVSDGLTAHGGSDLETRCLPLTLKNARIAMVYAHHSDRLHREGQIRMNYPDMHRWLVGHWLKACEFPDDAAWQQVSSAEAHQFVATMLRKQDDDTGYGFPLMRPR